MKRYNLENESIKAKYESYPAIFWSNMLRARAKQEEFNDEEPPTNWKDNINRYMNEVKGFFVRMANKGKRKLIEEKEIVKGNYQYEPNVSDKEVIHRHKEEKDAQIEEKIKAGELPPQEEAVLTASPDHRKHEAEANKE